MNFSSQLYLLLYICSSVLHSLIMSLKLSSPHLCNLDRLFSNCSPYIVDCNIPGSVNCDSVFFQFFLRCIVQIIWYIISLLCLWMFLYMLFFLFIFYFLHLIIPVRVISAVAVKRHFIRFLYFWIPEKKKQLKMQLIVCSNGFPGSDK